MDKYVLDFAPPLAGIEGTFNTFRLGVAWSKRVSEGDMVLLINKPKAQVIGRAQVQSVSVGTLSEMAVTDARFNHNQKGLDVEGAPARMIASMIKRYGPQMCRETSKVTVINLQMVEHGPD